MQIIAKTNLKLEVRLDTVILLLYNLMGSCSWNCRQFSHLLDSLSPLPLVVIIIIVVVVIVMIVVVMIVVVMIMIITINKVAVCDIRGATYISDAIISTAERCS